MRARDLSKSYYDVTNYYFEIDAPDADEVGDDGAVCAEGLRKKGVSKEKRPGPIIQTSTGGFGGSRRRFASRRATFMPARST
jgi:hypothetical protein